MRTGSIRRHIRAIYEKCSVVWFFPRYSTKHDARARGRGQLSRLITDLYGALRRDSQTQIIGPTLIALRRLIYGVYGEFTERLGNYAYQMKCRYMAVSRASKRCPMSPHPRRRISNSRNVRLQGSWILPTQSTYSDLTPIPYTPTRRWS